MKETVAQEHVPMFYCISGQASSSLVIEYATSGIVSDIKWTNGFVVRSSFVPPYDPVPCVCKYTWPMLWSEV